jgi:hypothetical protein
MEVALTREMESEVALVFDFDGADTLPVAAFR